MRDQTNRAPVVLFGEPVQVMSPSIFKRKQQETWRCADMCDARLPSQHKKLGVLGECDQGGGGLPWHDMVLHASRAVSASHTKGGERGSGRAGGQHA